MVNLSGENQSDQRDLIYLRFKEQIKTIDILKSLAIFLVRILSNAQVNQGSAKQGGPRPLGYLFFASA